MTKIVNLYGGPGTGKSTSAAYLFFKLKAAGENTELVREYVKDWAWEGRSISTYDQFYFLGKQIRRESMLYSKVDWLVTDSPVMLSMYYAQKYSPPPVARAITGAVRGYYNQAGLDGHKHFHVFLQRTKTYNPSGRFQTEEQAKGIDQDLKQLLHLEVLGVEPDTFGTDPEQLDHLLAVVRNS